MFNSISDIRCANHHILLFSSPRWPQPEKTPLQKIHYKQKIIVFTASFATHTINHKKLQQGNTNFDFNIQCRVVFTQRVKEILCWKQIRAIVSIDQKLSLCIYKALRYCIRNIRRSFRSFKISCELQMHLMQILHRCTRTSTFSL